MENEIADVGDIVPSDGKSLIDSLEWSFFELCKQLGVEINRLRLRSALEDNKELIADLGNGAVDWQNVVRVIALSAVIDGLQFMDQADPGRLPALSWIPRYGWVIIRSINAAGEWVIQANSANTVALLMESSALPCVRISSINSSEKISKDKPVFKLFYKEFFIHKPILIEIVLASVLINLMALGTSLYSMQVYDRVIPTQGYSTLAVLTFGVALTRIFDFLFLLVFLSIRFAGSSG
jgi:ATP-binding cassette subfamily C protein LapB